MAFEFDDMLADVHEMLAADAVVTPLGSVDPVTIAMIDHSAGIEIPGRGAEITSIGPAARVRATALAAAGLSRSDMRGATVVLNGKSYRVEATRPLPTPAGESDGELYLIFMGNA